MGKTIRFGDMAFSVTHHALSRDGVPVLLGGRALDILARLLEQPGEVVSSDELMRVGWGRLRVQPNNLSVQISGLRKVLGSRPGGGPFIRAVAGRGYMLCAEAVRGADEPPHSGRSWPRAAVTSFIGRTTELAGLRTLLGRARLVTVVGPGGVGKTRLIQEALGTVSRPWVGTDLAPAIGRDQVLAAIAAVLGDVHATFDAIVARLRTSPLLLVLDNAEHVATDLGLLLPRILAECPRSDIVVTSRTILHVAGETTFQLSPMEPPPVSATSVAVIGGFDCVKLFVERACAVQPGFVLSDDNAPKVAEICRRLDGIALAIEMLVPRLPSMSVSEIVAHLDERFSLLDDFGPSVLPRQRTLATMLNWSWELLDVAEKATLVRLAVFRAPVSTAFIAGVGPGPGTPGFLDGQELLHATRGLTSKSLAAAEPSAAETRFRLLQTTRDYVLAITPATELHPLRARHAGFLSEWFEGIRDSWPSAPTTAWLDRTGSCMDDLREALEWSTGPNGDPAIAVKLAAASLPLWLELPGTPLGEMNGWFDRVAPLIGATVPARDLAWFRIGQSWRATSFGDVQHRGLAEEAVSAARQADDGTALAVALMRQGHTLMQPDTMAEAAALFTEAEHLLRADAPGKWLCLVLTRRADATVRLGKLDRGLKIYEEAIDLAHALEFRLGRVVSISNMTEVLFTLGECDRAIQHLRSLVVRVPPGARNPALATLAAHLALRGDTEDALAAAAEVAEWSPVTGMGGPLAWAAETVALVLARAGRPGAAATIFGYTSRLLPSVGTRFGSRSSVHRELALRLSNSLSRTERLACEAAGARWSLGQAADAVQVHCRSPAAGAEAGTGLAAVGAPAVPVSRPETEPRGKIRA